jgi:hypothetical protein
MEHVAGSCHDLVHGRRIAHVCDDDLQAARVRLLQPGQVALDARPRQVVEDQHRLALG